MSKREKGGPDPRPGAADDTGTIEVRDSGQTLEGVLEEEERTALEETGARLRLAQKNFDELKDRHLRKLAEFENMRKRGERERSEYFRSALGRFLLDLFPISDTFDRALAHAPAEALETDFGQGVAMIRRQFDDLWNKYGVVEVDTSGPFDPNVHEAVATEPRSDVPKDTILDVLQKGYFLNDKLLRPALVKVAVPTEEGNRETGDGKRETK
jgi:molecular chaperone GrpE